MTMVRALALILALVAQTASAALSLEAGFPINKTSASSATKNPTTATFSTTAATLLVVALSFEGLTTAITATAVSDNTGVTSAWTKRKTATWTGGSFNGLGVVEIWTATASASFTTKTVTVTLTCTSNVAGSYSVYAIDGAPSSFVGASDSGGSTSDAATHLIAGVVTATQGSSFLVGAGLDGNSAGSFTAQAGTTFGTNFPDVSHGSCFTSFAKTALTTISTSYTVGTTKTDAYYGWVLLEILPANPSATKPTRTLMGVGT